VKFLLAALSAAALALPGLAAGDSAKTGLVQPAGKAGCVTSTGGSCTKGVAVSSPGGVVVAPNGRTVYAWGGLSTRGAIAVFARSTNGTMRQLAGTAGCVQRFTRRCRTGRALETPSSVALSADGRHAFVTGENSWSIASYRRGANGALSQIAGPAGCLSSFANATGCRSARGLAHAADAVVSPDGRNVYVAGDGIAVLVRNARTGVLAQLPGVRGCFAPRGSSGCAEARGQLRRVTGVTISRDGRHVYVIAGGGAHGALLSFARDRSTGALTQLAGTPGCATQLGETAGCASARALAQPEDVTLSRDNRHLYVASAVSAGVAVFARNAVSGALLQVGGPGGCVTENASGGACIPGDGLVGASSVAVSPDGRRVYTAAFHTLRGGVAEFSRSAISGALTPTGCVATGVRRCQSARATRGAHGVAVSPDGRNVYVAAEATNGGGVAVFRR
jgi:6-phosphogluconolactonase (cycloisomerase 2 family)